MQQRCIEIAKKSPQSKSLIKLLQQDQMCEWGDSFEKNLDYLVCSFKLGWSMPFGYRYITLQEFLLAYIAI